MVRRRRGLSLAETIMAIFLFVAGGLVCFELALSACRDGARVEEVTQATIVGENVLDGIRNWAYYPDNYLTNWSIYDDKDLPWEGGYQVHTYLAASGRNPVSPCSALEIGYPQREITDSSRVVRVKISWRMGGPSDTLNMVAVINEPPRNVRTVTPVVVTRLAPIVDPVVVNTTTRFQAALFDTAGREIKGVTWDWRIISNWDTGTGGMGSLEEIPTQALRSQIDLLHHYYRGDPEAPSPPFKLPGSVVMRATCNYDGKDYALDSAPVTLGP